MDDDHGAPIGGLSLWVGLASDKERKAASGEKPKSSPRKFGSWFHSKKSSEATDAQDQS
jgi:hypothetical protein